LTSTPFDERFALLFPGQGAQQVGMGKRLYETSQAAQRVFQQARQVLGFEIACLCFEGPAGELNKTFNTQPAVFVTSMAAYETLRERFAAAGRAMTPAFVAGHSFGEFAATVVSGAIDFADGLRLVLKRAQLMQDAQEAQPGGMISVLGLDEGAVRQVCATAPQRGEVLTIAVENGPGHLVLSGDIPAVERAMTMIGSMGGKSMRLAIGVGAHSPLMAQAGTAFGAFVDGVRIEDPAVPILSNVTAKPLTTSADVRSELINQFTHPVWWAASIREMILRDVNSFVEVGPGQVLSRLVRRINDRVRSISLDADPDAIERSLAPELSSKSPAAKEAP
jgi:[acyl-carrier-protein] S-malonyltransferase